MIFDLIKNIFGNKINYKQLVANGALIIDVRSNSEFVSGNILNSKNLPVDVIKTAIETLKKTNKPIIVCCASGVRSGMAKSILKSGGCNEVYNGGSWKSLQAKL